MPVLLTYEFAPEHETEDNTAQARVATYADALATIHKRLRDEHDHEYTLPELPDSATEVVFVDSNMEDWRGFVLVFGENPKFAMSSLDDDGCVSLTIDGVDYSPKHCTDEDENE